jgi:hypothetical protein
MNANAIKEKRPHAGKTKGDYALDNTAVKKP